MMLYRQFVAFLNTVSFNSNSYERLLTLVPTKVLLVYKDAREREALKYRSLTHYVGRGFDWLL